jgi:hypothetical protein
MTVFNKVVTILVLLKIIALSVIAVVNKFMNLFVWKEVIDKVIGFIAGLNIYILGSAFGVAIIVSLILLVLEFRRS